VIELPMLQCSYVMTAMQLPSPQAALEDWIFASLSAGFGGVMSTVTSEAS
jgi:hypothetical protein